MLICMKREYVSMKKKHLLFLLTIGMLSSCGESMTSSYLLTGPMETSTSISTSTSTSSRDREEKDCYINTVAMYLPGYNDKEYYPIPRSPVVYQSQKTFDTFKESYSKFSDAFISSETSFDFGTVDVLVLPFHRSSTIEEASILRTYVMNDELHVSIHYHVADDELLDMDVVYSLTIITISHVENNLNQVFLHRDTNEAYDIITLTVL